MLGLLERAKALFSMIEHDGKGPGFRLVTGVLRGTRELLFQ
jgi:hypothetical protein